MTFAGDSANAPGSDLDWMRGGGSRGNLRAGGLACDTGEVAGVLFVVIKNYMRTHRVLQRLTFTANEVNCCHLSFRWTLHEGGCSYMHCTISPRVSNKARVSRDSNTILRNVS